MIKVVPHFIDIERAVLTYVNSCDGILICTAWMTSIPLLDACSIIEATLIMTSWNKLKKGSAEYSGDLVKRIRKAIPNCYVYAGEGLMHNKFIVLLRDERPYAVITGSYNYTTKASSNEQKENIVYIEDATVASLYATEFATLLKRSKRLE